MGAVRGYRADIDGLRALAVIPVVLFHAGTASVSGGFVGVDVFFVISGFLITGILLREIQEGRYSIVNFYERRMRRIFPALFFVIACVYVVGLCILLPVDLAGLAKSIIATAFFVSNMLFWSEAGYFDAPAEMKPLLHTWSLAVEEQYYILFPLALFLLYRLLKGRNAVWCIAAACLISLGLSEWGVRHAPVATFYLLPTRAWELLLGSLLAMGVLPCISSARVAQGVSAGGLALIVASMLVLTPLSPFPGITALAPCLGAVLVIHAGANHEPLGNRILAFPPARFIGLISYSLYLWHWPIIVFTKYIWIEELTFQLKAAVVAASLAAAVLTWRFIERPFRNPARVPRKTIFASGIAAMAVATVIAVPGIPGGLPNRLPRDVVATADINSYRDAERSCHLAYAHRLTMAQLCKRGAKGEAASFVLVGDSHAGAVAGGIFEGARQAGLAGLQLTDAGYRPLFGLESLDEPDKYRWMNSMLERVLADHAIRTVMIVGYWQQAVSRYRYRSAAGDVVSGGHALYSGLLQLTRRYPDRRFIVMTALPAASVFGASAAARASLFGRDIETAVPRDKFDTMTAKYSGALLALSREPNVDLLDITDSLCDAVRCSGKLGNQLAYRDDNHLTNSAALRLAPRFRDALLSQPLLTSRLSK
jgi:peptidoglycan/LPS O-acetylase OafA/YrhL